MRVCAQSAVVPRPIQRTYADRPWTRSLGQTAHTPALVRSGQAPRVTPGRQATVPLAEAEARALPLEYRFQVPLERRFAF